jgi:quercetin dioxygenase-like cupin family protein
LPALSDSGDGLTFTMLGATMRLIASAADTDGRFAVFEQVTPFGWGPPRHIHASEDEVVYVLDGTYEFSLGDERRTLSAGGCAILPRGVPHGFRNVGSAAGRFLCLVAPGGLEGYFLTVGKCSAPPSPAQLVEMAKPYGLTLLPPGA